MSDEQTLYEDSLFYDLVHGEFATPKTLAFYEDKIARFGQPVLELASGTGAYVIPLAEKGISVVGVDISDEMLSRAKEKAAVRNIAIDLRKGDIRDFELNQKFPLILLLGNSLQHLLTREDVEKCFAAVKRHLTPNGRFIVEVFNPSLKILSRKPDENDLDSEYETEEGRMTLTGRVNYDAATQINHITWIYQNLRTGKSKQFSFTMRQFFPQELDALLHYNNFQIEKKFGDRDGSPFESNSPRQIVVANII
ncbi:MAG: class I SAM-dependent methyltransferase [Acidobacteriota bacterium]|nr:class I SAM-dependent methyltransferase [Acidobacteriota bacterium]